MPDVENDGLTRHGSSGKIKKKGGVKMPKSEKARASDARWKQKNRITVGCTLYRNDAAEFKAYAAAQGRTANDLIREYVSQCLGRPLERRTEAKEETAED